MEQAKDRASVEPQIFMPAVRLKVKTFLANQPSKVPFGRLVRHDLAVRPAHG